MTRNLSPEEQTKLLKTVEQLRVKTEELYKENLHLGHELDKVTRAYDEEVHENIVLKGELETSKARVHVLERSLKKIQRGSRLFLPIRAEQLDTLIHEIEFIFDKTQVCTQLCTTNGNEDRQGQKPSIGTAGSISISVFLL